MAHGSRGDDAARPKPCDVEILAQILEEQEQERLEDSQRLDPRSQTACVQSLERLLSGIALSDLLYLSGNEGSILRRHSLRALGRCAAGSMEAGSSLTMSAQVIPVMEAALHQDPHLEVRRAAALALGEAGAVDIAWLSRAVAALVRSMQDDPAEAVREACGQALELIYAIVALPELLRTLAEGESTARGYAVQALGERCAQSPRRLRWQVLPKLKPMLRSDASWWVRERVAKALEAVGVADPAGAGTIVVGALRRFLFEEHIKLMAKRLKTNQDEVEEGNRIQAACEEAMGACVVSLAFLGWRLQKQETLPLPSIVWSNT